MITTVKLTYHLTQLPLLKKGYFRSILSIFQVHNTIINYSHPLSPELVHLITRSLDLGLLIFHPLPTDTGNHHSTLHFYEFNFSLFQIPHISDSKSVCVSLSSLFHGLIPLEGMQVGTAFMKNRMEFPYSPNLK